MSNNIRFSPESLQAAFALRGYSVRKFVSEHPVVCEKTIYRAMRSGTLSARTLYRICAELKISPVLLLTESNTPQLSNWDIGSDVSECTKCKSLFITKYLLAVGRCEPPPYCPLCGAYMISP